MSSSVDALDLLSRRSPVLARHGMVAASQPLAAMAGIYILQQGGNAADAAIATAAALNVTEPTSTGLGGDCFALYYDARRHSVGALNGSGRAPAALTLALLKEQGIRDVLPQFHPFRLLFPALAQAGAIFWSATEPCRCAAFSSRRSSWQKMVSQWLR